MESMQFPLKATLPGLQRMQSPFVPTFWQFESIAATVDASTSSKSIILKFFFANLIDFYNYIELLHTGFIGTPVQQNIKNVQSINTLYSSISESIDLILLCITLK